MIIKLTLFCSRYLASVLLPLSHYSFHLPPIHHNWSFLFTLYYQYRDNEIKAHLYTCYICTPPFHTPSNYSSFACAPYWTIWNLPVLPRRWQFFLVLRHIFTPTTYTPSYTLYISSFLIFIHLYTHVKKTQTVINTGRPWCKSYLSITTDLNLLMVIPRVYQMMSLLEGNTSSEDQGKRNELLFAFLIIATLAVLGRTRSFLVHPFRGSSVHSNGNVRGLYLKFYRHGISYLTDWAVEIENM